MMKKRFRSSLLLLSMCLTLPFSLSACTATADEELTGQAQGYGGELTVKVYAQGADITRVEIVSHSETPGVGTKAIEQLPSIIASRDSWEVDDISGATATSRAIKAAVSTAMGGAASGTLPSDTPAATQAKAPESLSGVGVVTAARPGPGQDAEGNPVYSFHVIFAHGLFDQQGQIQHLAVDQLEITSPNADEAMSRFSGFPGDNISANDFLAEAETWRTKRGYGDAYRLTSGTWAQQMDAYQRMARGKTVDELESWFAEYFSAETGRPLSENSEGADLARYEAFTDAQKQQAAEIVSSATMSLRSEYGDILLAVRRAWENAKQKE